MTQREERRRSERYPFLLLVEHGTTGPDWSENLSAGGLFVRTNKKVRQGDDFQGTLSFPGLLDPFSIAGSVAWVRKASAWQGAGAGVAVKSGLEQLQVLEKALAEAANAPVKKELKVMTVGSELDPGVARDRVDVVLAQSSDEAIELFAKESPDLIITEVFAPLPDCLRTIKELKKGTKAPIFVVPSGDPDEDLRTLGAGADAVLPPRVDTGHLLGTMLCLRRLRET